MIKPNSHFKILLLSLGLLTPSCGRKLDQVQTPAKNKLNSDDAVVTDPVNCPSQAKCDQPTGKLVDENGSPIASKTAVVGETVNWTFQVETTAIAGRLLVAPVTYPTWATFQAGSQKGSKILTGVPDQSITSGSLTFVIRDMVRCQQFEAGDVSKCTDTQKTLQHSDQQATVSYSVSNSPNTVPGSQTGVTCTQSTNAAGKAGTLISIFNPTVGGVISQFGSTKTTCK